MKINCWFIILHFLSCFKVCLNGESFWYYHVYFCNPIQKYSKIIFLDISVWLILVLKLNTHCLESKIICIHHKYRAWDWVFIESDHSGSFLLVTKFLACLLWRKVKLLWFLCRPCCLGKTYVTPLIFKRYQHKTWKTLWQGAVSRQGS
jgi:hypothetical protein